MKVHYATITINVKATEEEVREISARELAVSDALSEITYELEEWLKKKAVGTHFEFEVEL